MHTTLHKLHYSATELIRAGVDVRTVAVTLTPLHGHSLVTQQMDRLRQSGSASIWRLQYLAYQIGYQARTGQPDRERVPLYPRQESQTDPKFIATNAAGDRLADALTTSIELRQRAMELGIRILDDSGRWGSEQLFQFLQQHHVPPPPRPTEVTTVQVPKLPLLEKMIIAVGECAA